MKFSERGSSNPIGSSRLCRECRLYLEGEGEPLEGFKKEYYDPTILSKGSLQQLHGESTLRESIIIQVRDNDGFD